MRGKVNDRACETLFLSATKLQTLFERWGGFLQSYTGVPERCRKLKGKAETKPLMGNKQSAVCTKVSGT